MNSVVDIAPDNTAETVLTDSAP
ncbi:hypothetical protein MNBD_GAMMA19-759, partial [hydrothermal vent metagenome]